MKIKKIFTQLLTITVIICMAICICSVNTGAEEGAAAELSDIEINGCSIMGFIAETEDYTIDIPYKYVKNTEGYVMPAVKATAKDPAADVKISYPDSFEGIITIDVKASDNIATKQYRLSLNMIGKNLYADGDCEGTDKWTVLDGKVTFGRDTNNVWAGNASLRIDRTSAYGAYRHVPYPQISPNKVYLASSMVRTETAPHETSNIMDGINTGAKTGTISYWSENGTELTNRGHAINLTTDWQRTCMTFTYTGGGTYAVKHYYTNWDKEPVILVDDYYVGELVIAEVNINGTKIIEKTDYTQIFNYNAQCLNQFGTTAGLKNEKVDSWVLINAPEGVSINEQTGELTVLPTAESGTFSIEARVTPGFLGAAQQRVNGRIDVTIADKSITTKLSNIKVNGNIISGFEGTCENYTIEIPYRYIRGESGFAMPDITAEPIDSEATVDIIYPDAVSGGTIKIAVTARGGILTKEYNIHLTTIGENLYADGGCEVEDIWKMTSEYISAGTVIRVSTDKWAGDYSLRVERNKFGIYRPNVYPKLSPDKTYLVSNMVKSEKVSEAHSTYNYFDKFTGKVTHLKADGKTITSSAVELSDAWQRTYAILNYTGTGDYNLQNFYTNWDKETAILIDDFYAGELIISDIEYDGETAVKIPAGGENARNITLSANVKNQLGTLHGLADEKVLFELAEVYQGVSINNNLLTVTEDALKQTILVKAYCIPSYAGAIQNRVERIIQINLEPNTDTKPRVRDLKLDGVVGLNNMLTVSYRYYQIDQIAEGATIIKWLYSDSKNGIYREIQGENGLTYIVDSMHKDDFICAEVTPVTIEGIEGKTVRSNFVTTPLAPMAENVMISGIRAIGQTLVASYDYSDGNNDLESGSTFRWLISDSKNGEFSPINGGTSTSYVIRDTDVDKYLKFEVTPRNNIDPCQGAATLSDPVLCATRPTVADLKINKLNNNILLAEYTYQHINNIGEGNSVCNWYIDNKLIGTGNRLYIDDTKIKVELRVTPVAVLSPFEGETKSVSINMGSSKTNIKYAGGGGGRIGGSVIVPVPEPEPIETEPEETAKHWASEAVEFVLSKGIMDNSKENDFCYDDLVTRAEFVHYIISAIGEKGTAYAESFVDVSEDEWYAKSLQTAVNKGMISRAEEFNPSRSVSREEVCKILIKAIEEDNVEINGEELSKFKDENEIAKWASDYVKKSVKIGLLLGVSEDEFMPKGNVTRAQTAVIAKRIADYIESLRGGADV